MSGQSEPVYSLPFSNQLPVLKPKSSLQINPDVVKANKEYLVFYAKQDKSMIEVKIQQPVLTIKDLIESSISCLNNEYQLDLKDSSNQYKIYAAKKSGKKKSDLPPFDHSQKVQKTRIFIFHIEKKQVNVVNPQQPLQSRLSGSSKKQMKMVSDYDPYSTQIKSSSNKQIAPKQQFGCFCWSFNK